jgi:hypothetical protein
MMVIFCHGVSPYADGAGWPLFLFLDGIGSAMIASIDKLALPIWVEFHMPINLSISKRARRQLRVSDIGRHRIYSVVLVIPLYLYLFV